MSRFATRHVSSEMITTKLLREELRSEEDLRVWLDPDHRRMSTRRTNLAQLDKALAAANGMWSASSVLAAANRGWGNPWK